MKKVNDCRFNKMRNAFEACISNLDHVTGCVFCADSVADELDRLADAVLNEEELYMDEEGGIHTEQDMEGLSSLNIPNMTKVNADPFAGEDDRDIFLNVNPKRTEANQEDIRQNIFEQEISPNFVELPDSLESDDDEMFLDDSMLEPLMNEDGVISSDSGTEGNYVNMEQELNVSGANTTRVSPKPFAAIDLSRKPSNPDQWYNKNPILFKGEVASMLKRHPKAKMGFLKATGNMYWIIETKIIDGMKPWTFLLEYEKDHPNNNGYGGSIHVQLLKSPSIEELRERARKNGRKGIPHIVSAKRANGEDYNYLCTRFPEDVNDGTSRITGAVQVAGWAADWALHFETGIRNKAVWNKWCDDRHFSHLMIP